jgi:hypothetical protein
MSTSSRSKNKEINVHELHFHEFLIYPKKFTTLLKQENKHS